jgi:pseudaminic acid cytidylyltransferase
MANLAIIPARGGSKRIEKKNVRDFYGKPIIAYPIQAAIKSGLFDEVMVSTDDKEIAEVAKSYQAKVPFFRSTANSNDHAVLADVIKEVINCYEDKGIFFDNICCILPTSPLITIEHLKSSYQLLKENVFQSVIPVLKYGFPIQRAFIEKTGTLKLREPEFMNSRSQDLQPTYHDSGQFYWINILSFKKNNLIFAEKTGFIELEEMEAQDVDNQSDWEILKLKYKYQIQKNSRFI